MRLAVVGAGWAGLAAAIEGVSRGAHVTLFEASRAPGGRARALDIEVPGGGTVRLDNGQHILIGAYRETLRLMQRVGVDPTQVLYAQPLAVSFGDGTGLQTPAWAQRFPPPLDGLAAILGAHGWRWSDRLGLLRTLHRWRARRFECGDDLTVQDICHGLPERALADLIEPLCVSALNLPANQASARVFLRVMHDALFGQGVAGWAPSALLLPRVDLGRLLPDPALDWLTSRGAAVHLGRRVTGLRACAGSWALMTDEGETLFDRVVWATAAPAAVRVMHAAAHGAHSAALHDWAAVVERLPHTAIATVYARAADATLPLPLMALRGGPAQFVFDRGQLSGDAALRGLLAFVISASQGERDALQAGVVAQAQAELGLALEPLQTVVEKRATFACLPGIERPTADIAPGLWAAGDHVAGPYPATLEAAVRSGLHAATQAVGTVQV